MKATITAMFEGPPYKDDKLRVQLIFPDAEDWCNRIILPVDALGIEGAGTGPHLGQELDVDVSAKSRRGKS